MAEKVHRNMTVKEVLDTYPATAAIFHKYHLLIVGKSCGPNEPLGFFTKAHGVEYEEFVKELEEAIEEGSEKGGAYEIDPSMVNDTIYQKFVKTAIFVAVTTGCLYGAIKLFQAGMAGTFDVLGKRAIQMHGSSQLIGWVGLFIMGFFYFILPRLKSTILVGRRWANLSFYLVLAGLLIRAIFYFYEESAMPFYPMVAGFLDTAAAGIFLTVCLRTLRTSQEPKGIQDNFLIAGMGWFLISGIIYTIMNARLFRGAFLTDDPILSGAVPPYIFSAWVHLFLMGFAFNFIFGISSRTVPSFLDTPPVRERVIGAFFYLFNVALIGYVWASFSQGRTVYFTTMVMIALFIWMFIYGLRVFEPKVGELDDVKMSRDHILFIKVAYGWLALSLFIALFQLSTRDPYSLHMIRGAANHGYTIGFITMMIIGYAMKMMPVFTGNQIWSSGLTRWTFWLLNGGNAARISLELLGITKSPMIHQMVATTGFVEVAALILFGINIWATMAGEARFEEHKIEEITGNETVYALTEQFPQIIPVLREIGFAKITNPMLRKTLGRAITLQMACREQGIDFNVVRGKLQPIIAG